MLHQSSGGATGNIEDARITMEEWEKTNKILFEILGRCCGKTPKRIVKDAQRDLWLDATEALDYGVIDEIIEKRK
jgi:ATP-dependent Clp protease protease subunit